jgi:ariadne-1
MFMSIGPWAEHGTAWYSCNRYDDKSGVEARDAQSRSRASLERYLHVRARSIIRFFNGAQLVRSSITTVGQITSNLQNCQLSSI